MAGHSHVAVLRVVLCTIALSGCFRPDPRSGAPCASMNECPSPLVCVQGLCVRSGDSIDVEVDAAVASDAPAVECSCHGDTLACTSGDTPCPFGCVNHSPDGAHCEVFASSNGVDFEIATRLSSAITIDGPAHFDGDTGKIDGALGRPAGDGVLNDIGYAQVTFMGTELAVFSFHALDVDIGGRLQFSGSRAIVFVVAGDVTVGGEVDVGAPCASGNCPGPGGGNGTTSAAVGGGCGGGAGGTSDPATSGDSGGGGGGGGDDGGRGGSDTRGATTYAGGAGGVGCVAATLEPLLGGSGGAGGGSGNTTATSGGGGGGAIQITALGSIVVTGSIVAGGAGGEPGAGDPLAVNAGAGAGGGAGGGILLEARTVTLAAGGLLAANGGGGGGGGAGTTSGQPGQHGASGAIAAAGGTGVNSTGANTNSGGAGGVPGTAAVSGADQQNGSNGGGGGGAAGRIYIHTVDGAPTLAGTISQVAGTSRL